MRRARILPTRCRRPRLPPLRLCGTQASFIETNLRDVRVEDVNLSGSYWQGVQTRGMAFVDSWLTDAFLVGVNFDGVNMNGPCRLQGADLGYARFTNAMLQELQLEGAKATGASFENSKMNVADFTRALLDGASALRSTAASCALATRSKTP